MTTALSHRVALAASVAFIAAACGGSTSNDGSATGGAGGGAGTGGGSGITCEHGGKTYQPGESFPAGDGCNDCSCTSDGSVAWAYQMTPHDEWDYDGINENILFEKGAQKLLAHFDRNGFGYVLDRTTGKLRIEGKEYVMKDGDVVEWRFNV